MDAPLAAKCIEGFLAGFERQAKKEEKEAEEIVHTINLDALKALCTRYDNKTGEYPEHEHEGAAVLAFFEELKIDVEKRKNENEKER